jgi:hypothetical protein
LTLDDLRGDFRLVLYLIWRHLKLPDPTPIQLDIAKYLQHGPKRRMVMAFRGVGKSWITAAYIIWYLLKNPAANVVVVSANEDRAAKFTQFVLQLIEQIPELRAMRPRHDQRRSSTGFDVGLAPPSQTQSVTAIGIFGNFTGDRADLLVADDVEVPKNSETATLRTKLADRTREFSALVKPETGDIVYLGTPQSMESIYVGLPDRGFQVRVWPILFPDEAQRLRYAGRLAPFIDAKLRKDPSLVGSSTEPGRFTAEDIEARRLDYKEKGFVLQFMLDPSLSSVDDYPLRLRDLLVHPLDLVKTVNSYIHAPVSKNEATDLPMVGFHSDMIYNAVVLPDPEWVPYDRIIMAIDPSGKGRDETGYAVLASMGGYLFLLDAGGVPGHGEADCFKLLDAAQKYKVSAIYVEPNYGGGTFASLLTAHMKTHGYLCSIMDSEWARGNKEERILATLVPVVQSHRLVVDRDLFQRDYRSVNHLPEDEAFGYRLFYQMTHLTGRKGDIPHDDRVESVAIAVAEMARLLGDRAEDATQRRERVRLDRELEDYLRTAQEGPKWREKEKARQTALNGPGRGQVNVMSWDSLGP